MKNNPKIIGVVPQDKVFELWEKVAANYNYFDNEENLLDVIEILPIDFIGSKFGHDGLRIEGSINYIKEILKFLKPLLKYKDCLSVHMNKLDTKIISKPINKSGDHYVIYIRLINQQQVIDF